MDSQIEDQDSSESWRMEIDGKFLSMLEESRNTLEPTDLKKDAAVAHDFYSIGINGKKGKTNFSYSKDLIEWMINSYFENNRYFDPSLFSSQVDSVIS